MALHRVLVAAAVSVTAADEGFISFLSPESPTAAGFPIPGIDTCEICMGVASKLIDAGGEKCPEVCDKALKALGGLVCGPLCEAVVGGATKLDVCKKAHLCKSTHEPQASNLTAQLAESHCLDAVDKYREKTGKKDIKMCSDKYQEKAHEQTIYDAAHGPHEYVKTKGWSGMCPDGHSAGQCEAMGQSSEDNAIKAYYNEGPGGGHYDILEKGSDACVACGFCESCYHGGRFYTHNFCSKMGAAQVMV